MVRLNITESGASVKVPNDTGETVSGPVVIVADGFAVGGDTFTRGEWIVTAAGATQTLPEVREFYFAAWVLVPFALLMGFRSVFRAML